ncbi:MAG TPA: RNA methyltransferase [Patescibacteria group bacterium]|nr:RNA methyltransferase [Patescibacteria group bacterium]
MLEKEQRREKILYVIIHNIRSAYNVGAIFRTADGAGAAKIYLTGHTPAPHDSRNERYQTKAQKMIAKTALGAEDWVKWETANDIMGLIAELKENNFEIIALEQAKGSVNIDSFKPKFPCALILGNEVDGMERDILEKADKVVEIPMKGKKESLNVSVAAGIAIYSILL